MCQLPDSSPSVGVKNHDQTQCVNTLKGLDTKPKLRLFELLMLQNMQMNQQLTFLQSQAAVRG